MAKIIVMGLGPGSEEGISIGTINELKNSKHIYLRTKEHPIVERLPEWDIQFESLDSFYGASNFEEVYEKIINFLLTNAKKYGEIVYVVPGSPFVAETSVQLLREWGEKEEVEIDIRPALSFLDAIYPLIKKDPTEGLQVMDAVKTDLHNINSEVDLMVGQVYDRFIASDVKLNLMEIYPDEYPIKVIKAAGVEGLEKVVDIKLYELDHLDWIDHLTSIYVPANVGKSLKKCEYPLDPLVDVMDSLLAPGGCPWDRKQTHESLKRPLLEESYEVIEAIDNNDMNNLSEELGDLLLQVVFHGSLAQRADAFDLNDIIAGVTEKMIRRHPHVFSHTIVSGEEEVLINWEKIKAKEKGKKPKSILGEVPRGLPALMHADKLQRKASKVGFDWEDLKDVIAKLDEEVLELKDAIKGTQDEVYDELGDVLFSIVNVARFLKINPEEALLATIRKFRKRFSYVEEKVKQSGKDFEYFSLKELDRWWEEAKEN